MRRQAARRGEGRDAGVFADQARKAVTHDYRQTAWVGTATLAGATPGLAVERFTRQGPLALLPLAPTADGQARAAMVWCVTSADDPVAGLTDLQRIAVLNTLLPKVGLGNIFRGVWPLVLVLVITLGILLAFPALSLWLPSMMI